MCGSAEKMLEVFSVDEVSHRTHAASVYICIAYTYAYVYEDVRSKRNGGAHVTLCSWKKIQSIMRTHIIISLAGKA